MARGLNRAELIGRIGNDVESRTTTSGTTVVNLRIATDESYTNAEGEKVEQTEWHNVVFFGKLADIVVKYLNKGDRIFVAGNLRTRKWQDREGTDRYTTEIRASEMLMLGGGKKSNGQETETRSKKKAPKPKSETAPAQNDDSDGDDDDDWAPDDELPF